MGEGVAPMMNSLKKIVARKDPSPNVGVPAKCDTRFGDMIPIPAKVPAGICSQNGNVFQDDGSGIWTLPPGECLSGTLTSHPPTTIVP